MSRSEMGILIGLSAVALVCISIRTAHHYGWGEDPIAVVHERPSSVPPIDLNSAGWEELTLLPGIGESRAKRIVAYRERVGEIRDPGELRQISGISDALVRRIRSSITVRRLHPDRER
ncbi:MAG: helix-hairpin-helix domain-containing protein [Planctomycetota bacterium]|nr:helix-hairpin-helix domain-containing protein [Planctomycetota bacterium]